MNDYIPSPDFLEQIRSAEAVPSAPESFVRALRARLTDPSAAVRPRSHLRRRVALGFALGAVLLAACVLIVGPQNVVAALQKILGYIPGIGFVESGSIRVLAEPVALTRDEITITLKEAVADSIQTILVYEVEGLWTVEIRSSDEEDPICDQPDLLRLPDGNEFRLTGGQGVHWGSGFESRVFFAAIPPDVNEAELVIPCISEMPLGKAPEDWHLPFHLKPAPPDMTIVPVLEAETPTVETAPPATPLAAAVDKYGISLELEKTVALDDGYVLLGRLHWTDPRFVSFGGPINMSVKDGDGMELIAEMDFSYEGMDRTPDPHTIPWAVRIQGKTVPGPIRLTVTSINIMLSDPAYFSFDTGPDPAVGEMWTLDREFSIIGLAML
jgi:hypothetical protein